MVVNRAPGDLAQMVEEIVQIRVPVDEINLAGVDHHERRLLVVEEIIIVGLVQFRQVIRRNLGLKLRLSKTSVEACR